MRVAVMVALAACATVSAQSPGSPVFRADADAVRVDVSVTRDGHQVQGLTPADFEIRDNGVLQQIRDVAIDDNPVNVFLTLDVSGSIEAPALDRLKQAAHAVIDALRPIDRLSVSTFASTAQRLVGWSANKAILHETIEGLRTGANTSVYDAVSLAASLRPTIVDGRMLVLLVTDGWDTASWISPTLVIDQARRTDLVVHVVRVSPAQPPVDPTPHVTRGRRVLFLDRPRLAPAEFLPVIAEETGGHLLDAYTDAQLKTACVRLLDEFRSRYVLSYAPAGVPAPGWHALDVKVKNRRADVKARRGYLR